MKLKQIASTMTAHLEPAELNLSDLKTANWYYQNKFF